ncbi:ABC transporter ATP-binding protein [Mycolicibacterium sp. 018/SC-01/001]|uniref:ABC transporter ATP-binding protein n=1 Tax=Mycolicibacterium sp. 018/SC-01/001 TaxID=2592069 RepID=UPI00117E0C2A|nr:ATP-binding cassette domain-containing protein [Mycolicibacterium sp. 018/SC-01/001]TRW80972.1 ABC transporter ATP-binding protein [Mycolicibacterium sp. 018/SC-01/001]
MTPDGAEPSHALQVNGLCKTFRSRAGGERVALHDVSFSIPRGSCLAVVGESGSGKTTAARIVAGLETASAGTVELAAGPAGKARHRGVQMVFQDPYSSLDPRQSVQAGLHELLRVHGIRRKAYRTERVRELLDAVGLDDRHGRQYPESLSGGQRQRVAIARALALDPQLLILDEAVSALDVSVQAQVLNLLSDIREQTHISYLFVSHDLGVVRQVSDTCVVLHNGRLIESGSTAAVLDSPTDPYTQALVDAVPRPGWVPRRRTA